VPFAIGSIIGSSQSSRLAQRLGRTVLLIGTALVVLGLAAVWLILLNTKPADLTSWELLAPLFFAGLGNGLFIAPNAQFIVATVDSSEAGAASGVISTMQRVGSAIGIAIIGSVLFGIANLSAISGEVKTKVAAALSTERFTSAQAAKDAAKALGSSIGKHEAAIHFGAAATSAMGVSVIFAFVAFVLVFTLPRRLQQQWGKKPE
jgi:hypothetical protein